MENFNKLTKQIVDTTKMLLIRLDELEVPSELIRIDYVKVNIDQNTFNIIRSEVSNSAIIIAENDQEKILLLNHGFEIVKDQILEKIIFNISEVENPEIDTIVFHVDNITELNINLQKKGLHVSKIEKDGNTAKFSLNKEATNIIFTNSQLAQNEELMALKTRLVQENEAKLRVMADFQNYKKRIAQIQRESLDMANKNLIDQIIEVVDDCKRAINNENHDGLDLLLEKLTIVLKNQGLEQINIQKGDKFNPETMEAISSTPKSDDQVANTVVHIDQFGYKYTSTNKTYRSAKVIVTK
ncbi:nucleotide exchange factor GrpE [Candidatus Dojkabacteria bacterium]|uniref:Protein GrpE n=1 Tax=Candidatus Dojkabacteria bacterium TaxID=2099670 RepID=A0A955I5X4_9BACT|nr:nucleotide exchange factor GrpE [Candidatus Dojkabacteria bacterium]